MIEEIVGHEVHSTLGAVLNTYGIIGFTLFGSVIVIWAKRLWKAYGLIGFVCLFVPTMLYGLTHNGTRFTFFWVLFAASIGMASMEDRRNRNRKQSRSTRESPLQHQANLGLE